MAAKRYWEVATIRRFAIYVNNWETFGTEGQWPLSGGGRYTEVAAIRGSTVFLGNVILSFRFCPLSLYETAPWEGFTKLIQNAHIMLVMTKLHSCN